MSKEWRPKDWKKLSLRFPQDFEGGADALMEALRQSGKEFNNEFIVTCSPLNRGSSPPDGLLVIIPRKMG